MAAEYLHGVETFEIVIGAAVITVIKSGVIGLTGTAPIGPVNTLTAIYSESDKTFGEPLTGFTIPQALEVIYAQGPATVLVVNVGVGTAVQVTREVVVLSNSTGVAKTAYNPIVDVVVVETQDDDDAYTILATTKYTIDVYGNIVITDAATLQAFQAGTLVQLSATYKKFDSASITNNMLIGSVDGTTNVRTGSFCFDLAYPTFGFKAKIFIMPGYSSVTAIAAQLAILANKFRGLYLTDAPIGATPAVAMAGRGPLGTLANFNTSNIRALLCYPHMKVEDKAKVAAGLKDAAAESNRPFSSFLAGVIAANDRNEGYWVSPSNHEILGATGVERLLTGDINDASTEVNQLNSVGIITQFNSFGTGTRVWGNRNASFPASNGIMTFILGRRVGDVIEESIERAMLPYIDKNITKGVVDSICESVNTFMRSQQQRSGKAVLAGYCTFDPAKNPPAELQNGHLVLDYNFGIQAPLERLSFNGTVDSALVAKALAA